MFQVPGTTTKSFLYEESIARVEAARKSAPSSALQPKSVTTSLTLRHGTFRVDKRKLVNFVFVPDGYAPERGTVVSEVLAALGLPEPDLAFYFHKGGQIGVRTNEVHISSGAAGDEDSEIVRETDSGQAVPAPLTPAQDKAVASSSSLSERVVANRVQSVLNGIADACAQTQSIFLLRQPFAGNQLSEMLCTAARQQGNCPVIGLFNRGNLSRIDPNRPADPRDKSSIEKMKQFREMEISFPGPEEKLGYYEPEEKLFSIAETELGMAKWGEQLKYSNCMFGRGWDLQRVSVGDCILESGATAPSLKEVNQVIDVSCNNTLVEQLRQNTFDANSHYPLLNEVSHAVVFGDAFPEHPRGSGCPDFTQSSEAQRAFCEQFQQEFPVGIIAAGGTEPLLKSAIQCLQQARPLFCFPGTGGSSEIIAKLIEFGNLKKQVEKEGRPKQDLIDYIDNHFKSQVDRESDHWRWWSKAMVVAQNFPEHYVQESALLIDVAANSSISLTKYSDGADDSVDRLQDKITAVMASVYNNVPELGGLEADMNSIYHANELHQNLLRAAHRFWFESTIIVSILRILFFATSVSAVLMAMRDDDEDTDDIWTYISMALPLLVGLTASVYATYRPMHKFAALWAAAHAVESELFRFRTRSHPYHATKSTQSGRGHRRVLASSLDNIMTTHLTGDVSSGAAQLVGQGAWRDRNESDSPFHSQSRGKGEESDVEAGQPRRVPATFSNRPPLATSKRRRWARVSSSADEQSRGAEDRGGAARTCSKQGGPRLPVHLRFLACDEYIAERALLELDTVQRQARWTSRKLRVMQLLALLGAAVCVLFQRLLPIWTPVVLTAVSTVEFFVTYGQLETHLPALNGAALAITRALTWWDGLSLIQQRMPTSRNRFVDIVETALLMQHSGFVQAAIANLGKDLNGSSAAPAAPAPAARQPQPQMHANPT